VKSEKVYTDKTKLRLFVDNLVGGIGWGIGSVLGAAFIVVFIGLLVGSVRTIPIVGEFVYNVLVEVQKLQGR